MIDATFKDVVLFARTGLNPRKNFVLGKGTNNYITIKNIYDNKLIIDDNTDRVDDKAIELIHKRSKIKKGDILFCSIGRLGDMYIIEEEPAGWDINESVFAFTLNEKIIRQKYFYYYFKNHKTINYLNRKSSGSTFKSIKMEQLKKMMFKLPSLDEQDFIIKKLDYILSILEKKNKQLLKLDELIKARFIEMFDNCENEALMGDVISISRGASPRPIQNYITKNLNGVNWIKIGDVSNDSLYITQTAERITQEGAKKSKYVKKGDFILSNSMSFGRPYILNIDGCVHDGWLILSEFGDTFNELYLYYALRSEYVQHQFRKKVNGATVKNLNSDLVKATHIKTPSITAQKKFANFAVEIDKAKNIIQKSMDETQLLFDSLMQEYFD